MKTFLIIILTCILSANSIAQELKVLKQLNSTYHKFQNLEIYLDADKIIINDKNQIVFSEDLTGKKVFKSSVGENYFLIANYNFSQNKVDYPVEIRVFDQIGMLVFPFRFLAPYDLPHPLLEINDTGILAVFDPLTFNVKFIGEDIYKEIELEKDIPFEMERAAYLQMNEDFLYILTSQAVLDITEEVSNVTLYRINILDLSVISQPIDYNTPTTLKLFGGWLFVSGVKFEDMQLGGKTLKYNLNLEELAFNTNIIEKFVHQKNKLYGKYLNLIYEFGNDLKLINVKQFDDNERITDITEWNNKLLVATLISGENFLHVLSSEFNLEVKQSLNIFGIKKLLNLNVSENTLIIHHDLKSTLLTLIEN